MPVPVPITATALVGEVETSTLATLNADPYVSVGGTRGVAMIELHQPQPGKGAFAFRTAGKNEKPLISIVVDHERSENTRASGIRGHFLGIEILIQAEEATTRGGRTKAAELVGQVVAVLVHNIDLLTHTWLASGYGVLIENRDANVETTEQDTRDAYTHRARARIVVEVRVPDAI